MTSISVRVARARSDKVGAVLKAAVEQGIEFVSDGDFLEMRGLETLSPADTTLLLTHLPAFRARLLLEDIRDPEEILEALDVELEEVGSADEARAAIATLPDAVGCDLETCARAEYQLPGRPLVITKAGTLRVHPPKTQDSRLALDPIRARARILSVFDPRARKIWVFDLDRIPLEALVELWSHKLVFWNAAFDLAILEAAGIALTRYSDGMQLAGLIYGCRSGTKTKPGPRARNGRPERARRPARQTNADERLVGAPVV
jgi:hypothetical protein